MKIGETIMSENTLYKFNQIFQNEEYQLPKRWDGIDFKNALGVLFDDYKTTLEAQPKEVASVFSVEKNLPEINRICSSIVDSVDCYLEGFPSEAYNKFKDVMAVLMKKQLKVYQKSVYDLFDGYEEPLKLFRVVKVPDNRIYRRNRVFHVPLTQRSKVSAARFSISGYPCLYLSTSIKLCKEEIQSSGKDSSLLIASAFQIDRSIEQSGVNLKVIELAIKPEDFRQIKCAHNDSFVSSLTPQQMEDLTIQTNYLLWYPLIAACSFIRTNKKLPFAAEYIIPQLLMQWVRSELKDNSDGNEQLLYGIRYFSCSSNRASSLGYNYVFPTSGMRGSNNSEFCPVLTKAFRLTLPRYIHEYDKEEALEHELLNNGKYKKIDED